MGNRYEVVGAGAPAYLMDETDAAEEFAEDLAEGDEVLVLGDPGGSALAVLAPRAGLLSFAARVAEALDAPSPDDTCIRYEVVLRDEAGRWASNWDAEVHLYRSDAEREVEAARANGYTAAVATLVIQP